MSTDELNEVWDIYDRSLTKITEKRRSEPLNKGEYHLVVSIFIYHMKNQLLLQKRSMAKLNYPGYWEGSAGGSALKRETHVEAIKREVAEELDLKLAITEADFYMRCIEENWIEDWFVFQTDFQVTELQLQVEEVERVKLFDFEKASQQLKQFGIQPYKKQLKQANRLIQENKK